MMNAIKPSLSRLQAAFAPLASVLAGYSHMESPKPRAMPVSESARKIEGASVGLQSAEAARSLEKTAIPKEWGGKYVPHEAAFSMESALWRDDLWGTSTRPVERLPKGGHA